MVILIWGGIDQSCGKSYFIVIKTSLWETEISAQEPQYKIKRSIKIIKKMYDYKKE